MKWIIAPFVALFGAGILVLGIVALRNGDTWDSPHSTRRDRMINPASAVLGGAIIAAAATYFVVASPKSDKEH
jgi:hypothetical protein